MDAIPLPRNAHGRADFVRRLEPPPHLAGGWRIENAIEADRPRELRQRIRQHPVVHVAMPAPHAIDPHSVHSAFQEAVTRWPNLPFLQVLPETADKYRIEPGEITYVEAALRVDALAALYRAAGYGAGHRVALLLENSPAFFMHWFALNAVGVSVVPINPDLRSTELEYLIAHSEVVLAVAIPARQDDLRRAVTAINRTVPVIGPDDAPPLAPFPGS